MYCSQALYQAILVVRLKAIQEHGDAGKYGAFFAAYLLKCLQDWLPGMGRSCIWNSNTPVTPSRSRC